jgi:Pilus formation protein N terminal region
MRRLILTLALALCAPLVAHAQLAPLTVQIDSSIRTAFAGKARDVVIGNPMIADVILLDSAGAVITGKEYGTTTITAFDADGRTVFARQVTVTSNDEGHIAYFRGAELNNYGCASRCERTPMPGEPRQTYDTYSNAYTSYAERQKPKEDGSQAKP